MLTLFVVRVMFRAHYPGTITVKEAVKTQKKLWSSEDYSTFNDEVGGGCWARILNQNYVNGLMTAWVTTHQTASKWFAFLTECADIEQQKRCLLCGHAAGVCSMMWICSRCSDSNWRQQTSSRHELPRSGVLGIKTLDLWLCTDGYVESDWLTAALETLESAHLLTGWSNNNTSVQN